MRLPPMWFVYQLTDADGSVLYVGMTHWFEQRMSNHYCADYGHRIASVATERFASEGEAAARETALIRDLSPELNVMGVDVRDEQPRTGRCSCGTPTDDGRTRICERCVSAALDSYLWGESTLRDLGRLYGITGERFRQLFDEVVGMPAAKVKRAYRNVATAEAAEVAEQKMIVEAEMAGVTCATCGRNHARRRNGVWSRTCSPDCAEMWQEVRYFDGDEWEQHQGRIASWHLRHSGRVDDDHLRNSLRVYRGDEPQYEGIWRNRPRRYLVEGSRRFEIAVRACREGWPSFATWPIEVQDQVRAYLSRSEVAA